VHLRPETAADHAAVRALHLAAFGDHGRTVADLTDDLRAGIAPTGGASLVAEEDGAVVGHVMLSAAWLDAPPRLVDVRVLSPLAVHPRHQRRGAGAALVRRALAVAQDQGAPLVVLEGDPGYYGRLGFRRAAGLGLRRPSLRIPDAAFQALALRGHEAWMTGTLVYPDVFWRHDAVGLRPSS
jgi:putative acetyltransferase